MVVSSACRTCLIVFSWWLLGIECIAVAVVAPRLMRAARGGHRLADVQTAQVAGSSMPVDAAPPVSVSVVVPARNESQRLTDCLAPLRAAPGLLEVIVVDDQSTDDTSDVARANGARVVTGAPLPRGWVGKAWALQQGVSVASGDIVVTLDADARPDASLPSCAAGALQRSGAVLATVAPRFRTTSRLGRWLHAAMLTSLVYRHGAGPGRAAPDAVGNGQCMVFRRTDAVHGGWFDLVKGALVEDVALVRRLVHDGQHVEMFDGSQLLAVQMFDGFRDTWSGWTRSLALSGVDERWRQVFDAIVSFVACVLPWFALGVGQATPVTLVLIALRIGTLFGTRRVYERRGVAYWASPVADVVALAAITRGIVAPSRQWRGRTYDDTAH